MAAEQGLIDIGRGFRRLLPGLSLALAIAVVGILLSAAALRGRLQRT